jgi:outer membrane lipoprotein SlyB
MNKAIIACAGALFLTGCATPSGQNQYIESDVGISRIVEFGTVLDVRQISITGKNSGLGGVSGGALGAAAGSGIGSGSGNSTAIIAGAIVGAVVGATAEQANSDRTGIEYTIMKENGKVIAVAQNLNEGDTVISKGTRVMIQTTGSYQRVLSAEAMPEAVKRPKGIKVVD